MTSQTEFELSTSKEYSGEQNTEIPKGFNV